MNLCSSILGGITISSYVKFRRFAHEGAQNTQDKHQTLRPLELCSCSSMKEIDEVSQLTDSPVIKKWIQD